MLCRVSARANLIIYLVWGFAHVHGWPWNNPLTLGRFHLWSGCHRVEGGLRHISIWFSPIGQINRCNLSASVNSNAHFFLALGKPPPPPPLLLICCWTFGRAHANTKDPSTHIRQCRDDDKLNGPPPQHSHSHVDDDDNNKYSTYM